MKSILTIILQMIIFSSFAQVKGDQAGNIIATGNYPALFDDALKGGFRTVRDSAARVNIPVNFRRHRMLVADSATGKNYQLDSLANQWIEFPVASTLINTNALIGGYRQVADTFARNAITATYRRNGMMVRDSVLKAIWMLDSSLTDRWQWQDVGIDIRAGMLKYFENRVYVDNTLVEWLDIQTTESGFSWNSYQASYAENAGEANFARSATGDVFNVPDYLITSRLRVTSTEIPSSSSDTLEGYFGEIRVGDNYLYIKTHGPGSGYWKRVPLETW